MMEQALTYLPTLLILVVLIWTADALGCNSKGFTKLISLCSSLKTVLAAFMVSGFVSALIAVLAISAGAVISLYASEIKGNYLCPIDLSQWKEGAAAFSNGLTPFYESVQFHVPSLMFTGSLLGLFFLTMVRDRVMTKMALEDQKRIKSTVLDVRGALASVPPYHVLRDFQDNYRSIWGQTYSALSAIRQIGLSDEVTAEIYLAIRSNLDSYIQLARDWDGNLDRYSEKMTYRANIMIYRPKEYIEPGREFTDIECGWRFSPYKSYPEAFKFIDGVLSLDTRMTTTTETLEPSPDEKVQDLYLLVSSGIYDGLNIPGAAKAVATGRVQWIKNSHQIESSCGLKTELKSCLPEIKEYYDSRNECRSILSVPIKHRSCPWGVLGVMNIYRDAPNIFGEENRVKDFHAVLSPFNYMISELLWAMISGGEREAFGHAIAVNDSVYDNARY